MELALTNTTTPDDNDQQEQPVAAPAPTKRSPAAERMRRHRARRKLGCRVVQVEVAEFDIIGLVKLGHLDPDHRDDPIAIEDALYRLFDETIARR
jgi:hypothetical protein